MIDEDMHSPDRTKTESTGRHPEGAAPGNRAVARTMIAYDCGTLLVTPPAGDALAARITAETCQWDERSRTFRAQASSYRKLVTALHEVKLPYEDRARAYELQGWALAEAITPRPHQSEALAAWSDAGRQGTVCLPTGAGKTILAIMAMAAVKRPTLILVPTIDLMWQWAALIERFFRMPAGLLGGGEHRLEPVTVATYDSGQIHIENIGQRFAFLVFDEVHHLPAPQYRRIAMASIAPFRMGLSATVERADGLESIIYELVGPQVYIGDLHAMVGRDLADYEVATINVEMTADERAAYDQERGTYRSFVKANHIVMNGREGWQNFIRIASRTPAGREALRAFHAQKRLAQSATGKINAIWDIIGEHPFEKVIVFTHDNAMAYRIGRVFFVPVLTHQTKARERKQILDEFKAGRINVIVTSRVLNEGVDVPDASIGIIVSGTSTVREHVQRLGRILRASKGKRARLFELVAEETSETHASRRRRQHHAYQGAH